MTYLKTLARAAGLGLCVAALSGTALADPGNGNGNGPATTPPGQEQKAETPAASAPAAAPAPQAGHGQAQKAENQAKQAAKKAAPKPAAKPATSKSTSAKAAAPGQAKKAEKQAEHKPAKADKPAKPAKTSGSYKETSLGKDEKKGMAHKHTICHATGSDSNPYVRITPSVSGVFHGHMDHQGDEDIVPPFVYKGTTYSQNWDAAGQALFANGCAAPASSTPLTPVTPSSTQTTNCPTATRTETVVVGVLHATGAFNKDGTRKYVEISPSQASAHYDRAKHPDDKILTQQVTTTVATGANCESAPVVTQGPITPTAQQPTSQQTVQPTAQAAVQPVGGVAGAVSPAAAAEKAQKAENAKKGEKPAGGVLGAVASAPEAVAETATSGTLPFTGIPLWIAALIGGALLATGLVLRRSSAT